MKMAAVIQEANSEALHIGLIGEPWRCPGSQAIRAETAPRAGHADRSPDYRFTEMVMVTARGR
jgi:hypothetical protein